MKLYIWIEGLVLSFLVGLMVIVLFDINHQQGPTDVVGAIADTTAIILGAIFFASYIIYNKIDSIKMAP